MTTTNHEQDDNSETQEFQPEIIKMLAVSKSLFTKNSNKHCLQELISTAAESIDRLRYQLFVEKQESELDADHFIRLIPDTLSNTLTIWDSGIGMTRQDLLSCFCHSPWVVPRQYMESLNNGEEVSVDRRHMVLGLFSSFLVAHKVVIYTKHKDDKQYVCEATGDSFTIRLDNGPPKINRGTYVVLHLLQNQHEDYLDAGKLKSIVNSIHRSTRRYIELPVKKVELHESSQSQETTVTTSFERVYHKPFWAADPKKASEKDYRALFNELTGDSSEDYLAYKRFAVDGMLDFTALFYIPLKLPTNELTPRRIQLYVSEELALDSCKELLPDYLSFITGLVNSEDLPHSISSKYLQESKVIKAMRKHLVKQCLEMFIGLAEDEKVFSTFYAEYGHYIKLGVCTDSQNRSKLIELLRYHSTRSPAKYVSLKDYLSNLKESQTEIYYTSEDPKLLTESSLQEPIQLGYEVLFMTDAIDKLVLEVLKKYEGRTLVQVSQAGLERDKKHTIEDVD